MEERRKLTDHGFNRGRILDGYGMPRLSTTLESEADTQMPFAKRAQGNPLPVAVANATTALDGVVTAMGC